MLKIGHRGAAGHAPENTIRAIEAAIALKADLVEVDLRRTKDGHIVLLHDRTVDRTTNGSGPVAKLFLQDIRRLDAGQGQRIPTLDELLRAASGRVGLMLEMKVEGLGEDVLTSVRQIGFAGPVIYASFFHREVQRIHELDPKAVTLVLLEGVPINSLAFVRDARATCAGIGLDSLTPTFVGTLRSAGIRVFTFTANDPSDIQFARSLLVDGIISDFPDRL